VSAAGVGGTNGADFSVVSNGCDSVAPGSACAVFVRFTPSASGPRSGQLLITDSSTAGSHIVDLHGRGIPGHTSFSMRSDAGDWIGGGQSYDYTPANATMSASATTGRFDMSIDSGPDWWDATLKVASGDVLTAGTTYTGATRAPFSGNGVGLEVSGSGRGCNTLTGSFTVIEAVFRDGTGPLQRFAATFEQHCEGGTPALHGWIAWRATEENTPAATPSGTPPPVANLTAYPDTSSVVLGWHNPTADTFQNVVVRGVEGTTPPASPAAGSAVYSGTAEAVHVSGLTPGQSYAFSVFAHGFDGTYAAARTIVLHGTDIVLTASPPTVTYGSATTLSATLVDAVTGATRAGQNVDFYLRQRGTRAYSWLGTFTTNSAGVAATAIHPPSNYEVRVAYYGLSTFLGATYGPIPVNVRPAVSATLAQTSVVHGGYVALSTTVAPNHAGQTVYLQKYYSGAWHTVLSHALSSSSAWTFTVHPTTVGKFSYRVYKPADSDHVAAYSAVRTLTAT
jgi:hypothetical protein